MSQECQFAKTTLSQLSRKLMRHACDPSCSLKELAQFKLELVALATYLWGLRPWKVYTPETPGGRDPREKHQHASLGEKEKRSEPLVGKTRGRGAASPRLQHPFPLRGNPYALLGSANTPSHLNLCKNRPLVHCVPEESVLRLRDLFRALCMALDAKEVCD